MMSSSASARRDFDRRTLSTQRLPSQRVLVVEDDPSICDIMATLLRQEGYSVAIASTVRAAEQRMSAERFDLIVTDLRLPHESGLTFVRRLRQLGGPVGGHRYVPVIMISGGHDRAHLEQVAAAGVSTHVQKPFRAQTMAAAVKRLLTSEAPQPFSHLSESGQPSAVRQP